MMSRAFKIAVSLVFAFSLNANAQIKLLLAKKQTPKEYANYAAREMSAYVPMSEMQRAQVYIVYYNYAVWLTAQKRDKSAVQAYKQVRNDTLRNILGTPGYYIPEVKK